MAADHFADSYDRDPLVMPEVTRAIDSLGWDVAFADYRFLENLVQSEETINWAISQSLWPLSRFPRRSGRCSRAAPLHVYSVLAAADPRLIAPHLDELAALPAVSELTMADFRQRVAFLASDPEQLWGRLVDLSTRRRKFRLLPDGELNLLHHLVEALARHPDQPAERILAEIDCETCDAGSWLEIFSIRLAGMLKLKTAVPHLLEHLQGYTESSPSHASDALVRIGVGCDDVVEALIAAWRDDGSWWAREPELRRYITRMLGRFHCDLAATACMDLMQWPWHDGGPGELLLAALRHFTVGALARAIRYVRQTPLAPGVIAVRRQLLTTCRLMHKTFPDHAAWEADAQNDAEFLRRWREEHKLQPAGGVGGGDAPQAAAAATTPEVRADERDRGKVVDPQPAAEAVPASEEQRNDIRSRLRKSDFEKLLGGLPGGRPRVPMIDWGLTPPAASPEAPAPTDPAAPILQALAGILAGCGAEANGQS